MLNPRKRCTESIPRAYQEHTGGPPTRERQESAIGQENLQKPVIAAAIGQENLRKPKI